MLTHFDWLRLAFTGAELLSTLHFIAHDPAVLASAPGGRPTGAPLSALGGPCERCWFQAPLAADSCCAVCRAILRKKGAYTNISRHVVLVWGYVNRLPRYLRDGPGGVDTAVLSAQSGGYYIADEHRFLQVLIRRDLQAWLHDLLLYDGGSLQGLLQIFPTAGVAHGLTMNDLLCRVVSREAVLSMDQLHVRFYALPYHILRHYTLEQEGLLNFSASEFLGMLEMATVFRQMLHPREQDILRELLTTTDLNQEQFYWGRFLGMLSQEARDMLHAWQVRQWSKEQVKLFYQLLHYVYIDFPWLNR